MPKFLSYKMSPIIKIKHIISAKRDGFIDGESCIIFNMKSSPAMHWIFATVIERDAVYKHIRNILTGNMYIMPKDVEGLDVLDTKDLFNEK